MRLNEKVFLPTRYSGPWELEPKLDLDLRALLLSTEVYGVSGRLLNCLINYQVTSIRQLSLLSDKELLRIKNLGKGTLRFIRQLVGPDPTKGVTVTMDPSAGSYLAKIWMAFDRGDSISDQDLKTLIESAETALTYLDARGERFVSAKTRLDLYALRSYLDARKQRP